MLYCLSQISIFFFFFFSYICISQGSVATPLWCGGISDNHFIANYPQNVLVKNF